MKGAIYVETTIFSFYHDERSSPAVVAMREWTRDWWDNCRQGYELITSTAVLAELDTGSLPHRQAAFTMACELPAVPVDDAISEIVSVYISHHVMPSDPVGDALHLALASFHKFDHLLTWNCRHLANANKFPHIRRINALLGLHVPELVTPLQLSGGSDQP